MDAVGVRNYGSTMPECEHSVAALALYAFVALVRMAPVWWGISFLFMKEGARILRYAQDDVLKISGRHGLDYSAGRIISI